MVTATRNWDVQICIWKPELISELNLWSYSSIPIAGYDNFS